ncbi:response regulator transcription factor [Dactylosporangium sp. NPDC049525]|uniref:response regulator transcription factor n=1 Tax=Dactylosporangium sp. NPDC049525 TaxID=3154730 RepID=UPI0034423DD4
MSTATMPAVSGTCPAVRAPRTVLLVDDHRIFTDVLAFALDAQPDLRCVAVANSAREGLAKAAAYDFDVAIVDLHLPDAGGLAVVEELRAIRPAALLVVLTGHPRADLAAAAHRAGADAFLAKDDALHAVLGVLRGAPPPSPRRRLADTAGPQLTPREHEVLASLASGADARTISHDLGLSMHTVRDYIKTILAKFGVHTQHAAVVAAIESGLVTAGKRHP